MDDGEFNLSNTIGIGLNIGEQMLLPVANGAEAAELVLQQQQQLREQLHQQLNQDQQHHYVSNVSLEQQNVDVNDDAPANISNSPETTTNVTCLDNSIGSFYQENTDLEDLNAKLVETTTILDYAPAEKPLELLTAQQKEHLEPPVVEEIGTIVQELENKENKLEEEQQQPEEAAIPEKKEQVKDNKSEEDKEKSAEKENVYEDEDVEEVEPEDIEVEETDADEEVEEVVEEDEDEVEEEIIPDEVIVPENTQNAVKHKNQEISVKTKAKQDDNEKEADADGDEEEQEEDDAEEEEEEEEEQENQEAETPISSVRAARRQEEEVDENQCRVCCSKENLVSIFKKVENRTVADLLMTICPSVSIVIKDFLPQYICNTCCDNVDIAIKLKNQCETTEKEFRKKLSRHKNKIRRPVGYVVIDAPLDSDPPTDEEPANDEEFKVSDIASATPSEDSDSSDFSDGKKKKRGRKRRKSAVVTPTEGKKFKTRNKSDDESSEEDEDDGDPIKQKRKRSTNSSPENFDCNECGQSFTRKQSLVLHKRQHVYDRGEPIKCEVCGKQFKIKGAYRTHLEKHKEERRTNKCLQCSKRFTSFTDLKRHISEEHREKNILPTCSKCSRTFSSAGRLLRHKQNGCVIIDATKVRKTETNTFVVGTDLFKAVAPLQSTYWSDSFSD